METIQVVLDAELLNAADQVVRRTKKNRSSLIRDALREHLKRLAIREKEERDRKGYEKIPANETELGVWDAVSAWPED